MRAGDPPQKNPGNGAEWPAFEQVEAVLQHWARRHGDRVELTVPGTSTQGRPVYALSLTDPAAPDADKEHVLITGLHSGVERTATTGICALIEWLLGPSVAAVEILRRQRIVCMPVPDPDNYVAGRHGPVYSSWCPSGPRNPDDMPEGLAVQRVLEALQPEVHADLHGLNLAYPGYTMLENSGASYSNLAIMPYHRRIVDLMDDAALEAGFPSDRHASDAEQLYWGPDLDEHADLLWRGRPRFYAAFYAYLRFHTMPVTSEVCWDDSTVARHRRLLDIGNGVWEGEHDPGYPVRVVRSNNYHMITAWGRTAAERRASRVELWQHRAQLTHGMPDPSINGRAMHCCALTHEAARHWLPVSTLAEFANRIATHPGMDGGAIRTFLAGWPAGQNGPSAMLSLDGGGASAGAGAEPPDVPLSTGLAMRLRLFDPHARPRELRLNGRVLDLGDESRVRTWRARGITCVEVVFPPEAVREADLFVVTLDYEPGARGSRWSATDALRR